MLYADAAQRFYAKTKPERSSGCLLWIAATNSRGYGLFWLNGGQRRAHRVCWEMHNGPIPDDLWVCHTCDNPRCVNLAHLFLGTAAENSADMVHKGRSLSGEAGTNTKLTAAQVAEIRRRCSAGETQRSVARRFGVDRTTVRDIVHRKNWRSLLSKEAS